MEKVILDPAIKFGAGRYKLEKDKEALRLFMKGMDMPLTLKELGVEPTQENLDILEAYLIDSPYVEQTEESFQLLHEAMKQMIA